jgi:hypothetical protein
MAEGTDRASTKGHSSGTWEKYANRIIGALAVGVLGLGTVVYRLLEDWSWVDSFYFSAVALTTVGFGDVTPTSDLSKIFTVFYIFGGISLIGLFLNELFKRIARRAGDRVTPPDESG